MIMYYCGSAGAPSWVDCAGAETLPLVVRVSDFMRIISTMPDDLGIRLINLVIGYNT